MKPEHILRYDKLTLSFTDIAHEPLYNSTEHGLRWLLLSGRALAVIADRNWSPAVSLDNRCHFCSSPYSYAAYQWDNKYQQFVLYRRLNGTKEYSQAEDALKGDWSLVQSLLRERESREW